jgi:MarR family transcriptional regulator for hemolysin
MGSALNAIGKKMRTGFSTEKIVIQPSQFGLLVYISKDKDVIQTELASLLDRDKSAVLREIDILEENGLVRRVNDAVDRRKKFVIITDKGKKVLKHGTLLIDKMMNELLDGLPENEKEIFYKVLVHLENKARQ